VRERDQWETVAATAGRLRNDTLSELAALREGIAGLAHHLSSIYGHGGYPVKMLRDLLGDQESDR
jgi:hypothetical protein